MKILQVFLNSRSNCTGKLFSMIAVVIFLHSCRDAGVIVPESYGFELKWGTYWDHSIRKNVSFVSQINKLYLHNCNDKDSVLSSEEFTITPEQADSLYILSVLHHRDFNIEFEREPSPGGATIELSLRVGDKSVTDRYLSCKDYNQNDKLSKIYGIIRRITGRQDLFR